ncbi:hypothetical protein [Nocardioides currus]|uniref:Uncharacterized protein n=1 Tax=Nocardioides currus TaxID=2133958 RepID=A0A2R7YVR2_9ACTN|nr:hypothetical protein [Nocardioides currus]PUA79969.1 hypothetical protein C7S10_15535 [Nocardioides currus]
MRFDPKADIGTGRVDDAGSGTGGRRLPIPTTAGGGKLGLVLLILGFVVKYLSSRRAASAAAR